MRITGQTARLTLATALLSLAGCEDSEQPAPPEAPTLDTRANDSAPEAPRRGSDTDHDAVESETESETTGIQLGEPTKIWVAAMRWKRLWRRGLHDGVRLTPSWDGRFALLAPWGATPSEASKLAEALELESSPRPYPKQHLIVPELLQTTTYLGIRSEPRPRSKLLVHVPRGTVVVGLRGEIEGWASREKAGGGWTYVAASPEDYGWSIAKGLRADSGCLPSPMPMIDGIKGFNRDFYRRRILYVRTALFEGAHRKAGFLILGLGTGTGYSYLGAFAKKGRGCALEEGLVHRISFPRDVFVVGSERNGGESLLVVSQGGLYNRESVTWEAYRLGETNPFWKRVLLTRPEWPRGKKKDRVRSAVTREIDGERRYYPLQIIFADGREELLRFEEGRFVADR